MKYPRTFHLPFSPGCTNDDRVLESVNHFIGPELVCTEKKDGSNVCMETIGCFARSHASAPKHSSFDAFKAFYATKSYILKSEYQYFAEWMLAKHSIEYSALPDYFLLFGIRTNNTWLSWDDTESEAKRLALSMVPVLYRGTVGSAAELEKLIANLSTGPSLCGAPQKEGVVVRLSSEFNDFARGIAKYVRKEFAERISDDHWAHKQIIRNKLKNGP